MTEMIRRAVRRIRSEESQAAALDELLRKTSGIRAGDDGLEVQKRLRDEWDRCSA
jgi:hypothetical protein